MIAVFALSFQSEAAVIDLFSSGIQEIAWPPVNGQARITSTATLADSLFTTRFLSFYHGGSQSLAVIASEQALEYRLSSGSTGYFQFGYRSPSPINLLADGATMLRFHFDDATAGTHFPAQLEFATAAGMAKYSWDLRLTSIFNSNYGAFTVDVPFSQLRGGDLTSVTAITFDGYRISEGAGFRLSKIETVPETTMMGMLLLAASSLTLKRSRM